MTPRPSRDCHTVRKVLKSKNNDSRRPVRHKFAPEGIEVKDDFNIVVQVKTKYLENIFQTKTSTTMMWLEFLKVLISLGQL